MPNLQAVLLLLARQGQIGVRMHILLSVLGGDLLRLLRVELYDLSYRPNERQRRLIVLPGDVLCGTLRLRIVLLHVLGRQVLWRRHDDIMFQLRLRQLLRYWGRLLHRMRRRPISAQLRKQQLSLCLGR